MAWLSALKELQVTDQTGHPCATPGVSGSALSNTQFDFTPDEFYIAAAFCSHMHPVAPTAATPEADMIRALVARHVDDIKVDFAIEATADSFKDYVKSYFSGTVATALGFLAMVRSGYDWAGHFEHFKSTSAKGRMPDFVFSSIKLGTCLVESKGTRSAAKSTFRATVEQGYLEQVERHLGSMLAGGTMASHGYCIGAWMTSVSKAELIVYHTNSAGASWGGGGRPDDDLGEVSLEAVQQQDMATAMSVALGPEFGQGLRFGFLNNLPPLVIFKWLGSGPVKLLA